MYPHLMYEIARQRAAERQEAARKTSLARALHKSARRRDRDAVPDILARPIPDYVDGTFRAAQAELPAGHRSPAGHRDPAGHRSPAGHVGAARK
jgi:hypothetical protein